MDCVLHQIALRDSIGESNGAAKQDLYFKFFAAIIPALLQKRSGAAILDNSADFRPDRYRDILRPGQFKRDPSPAERNSIQHRIVGRQFAHGIGWLRISQAGRDRFGCRTGPYHHIAASAGRA